MTDVRSTKLKKTASESKALSYEGVEALENYRDQESIESYRSEALAVFAPMSEFIISLSHKPKFSIVEVGSGNSALLYNFENKSVLESGVGIEISKSRHAFAEKWREDMSFLNTLNFNGDFLDAELNTNTFDFFVCNGTFHIIGAISDSYPLALINKAYSTLRSGGMIVLDIPTHKKKIGQFENGAYTFEVKLPDTNPFDMARYHMTNLSRKSVYQINSSYFDASGLCVRKKSDEFYSYSENEVTGLLKSAGFVDVVTYSGINKEPYEEGVFDTMLVVARK